MHVNALNTYGGLLGMKLAIGTLPSAVCWYMP
jgi:hypothetical protein